jgi:hypothetical protein
MKPSTYVQYVQLNDDRVDLQDSRQAGLCPAAIS